MNYAIETLLKEKSLIEKALSEWGSIEYPEAKKVRDKRLSDINQALKKLNYE